MRKPFANLGAILAFLLLTSSASADVVDSPPDDCPNGTRGNTCHGGPHCQPRVCADDADCTDGTVCELLTQCIERLDCGGLRPPDADPADFEIDIVRGRCPSSCAGECRAHRVCVRQGSGGGSDGCGCRVPAPARSRTGAALAALALGAIVVGFAVGRRRR